jgi:hypothetical protein
MYTQQLSPGLDPMHALRLFCRIEGQPLSRWEAHCADPVEAIDAVREQLHIAKVFRHGAVLAAVASSANRIAP